MSTFPDHDGPDPAHAYQISRAVAILRVLLFLRLAARLRRQLPPPMRVTVEPEDVNDAE